MNEEEWEAGIVWDYDTDINIPQMHKAIEEYTKATPLSYIKDERVHCTEWAYNGVLYNWAWWSDHKMGQLLAFENGVELFKKVYGYKNNTKHFMFAISDALLITLRKPAEVIFIENRGVNPNE